MKELVRWPILTGKDFDAVERVMRSGRLVGGLEAEKFAREWAEYVGTSHCVCVSSCTHALHLALRVLGVKEGDEVIVPALTFCGSAAPIVHCGAVPIFADVHPRTFNLDPADVRQRLTARTRAIVAVHLHGLPCDLSGIAESAPGVPIVEDACQAHGASISGRRVGGLGAIGCFSLNQVKPLGGGQGGMVVANDKSYWELARVLASHGGGDHVGFSYGITEFAAALARSQLLDLEANNSRARRNASLLNSVLGEYSELLPVEPPNVVSTWHKYRLLLPQDIDAEIFAEALNGRGVPADRWPGCIVPERSEYRRFANGDYPVALDVQAHSVIVGSEEFPLAAQDEEVVGDWGAVIDQLIKDMS